LEDEKTQAKISMRDAKQLVESFCLACADKSITIIKSKSSSDG
jgi:hypothetical protein